MSKHQFPPVAGVSFIGKAALKIVLANVCEASVYTTATQLEKKKGTFQVVMVEDTSLFNSALKSGANAVLVIANFGWLERRAITCVDAERRGDTIHMRRITPNDIIVALREGAPFTVGDYDKWLNKGDVTGRCAGCALLLSGKCKLSTKPTKKQPCGGKAREELPSDTPQLFNTYSLANLVFLSLHKTNEELLLATPKEVWAAAYQFAIGEMQRNDWIRGWAQALRSAGTDKWVLKELDKWVKAWGNALAQAKKGGPVSKLDRTLAAKFKTA